MSISHLLTIVSLLDIIQSDNVTCVYTQPIDKKLPLGNTKIYMHPYARCERINRLVLRYENKQLQINFKDEPGT